VQQIIATTRNVNLAVTKRQRARARWDFVRSTVWKGHLPERLVEEARWHKIHVFAKERELIRRAYMLYFERPPCPEVPQGADGGNLLGVLQEEGAAAAARRLLSKHTDRTFDEYLERYLTIWRRIRRWLVRKFYQVRHFLTGDEIPPESPTTIKRTITVSKNESYYA
ncbi:hypothetical protein ElyMa_002460400, partial [Elysia marginata]